MEEKDLLPGQQLVDCFRPFLAHLASLNLAPKSFRRHIDHLWLLGGRIIRDLNETPLKRTTAAAEDLAVDTHGNLYVATRLGIQICDQNGRVRAILPLPTPSGSAHSLCFGGRDFDVLYVTDESHVFSRRLKLPGFAPWAAPIAVKSQGAG